MLEVADLGREALDGAARDGDRGQERGVAVALDDLGADRIDGQPELVEDLRLDVGVELGVGADRTGDLARGACPRRPSGAAGDPASSSNAHDASLSPNVIGSAWTEWVRPIMTVPACSRAWRMTAAMAASRSLEQQRCSGPALERQRRVHDVAAGQPEVQVAALRPDGLGDLADEGDDVVVGGPFELGDAVDVDARPALDGGQAPRAGPVRVAPAPGHRQLHAQHVLEARLVGPDSAISASV